MVRQFWLGAIVALLAVPGTALAQNGPADLSAWAGAWSASAEQSITITESKKSLAIEGWATWGASDPERVASGGVNVGDFSVTVPKSWVVDNRLVFIVGDEGAEEVGMTEADGCLIEMQLEGEVLMVGDNMMCGGMNVSFSGAYERE